MPSQGQEQDAILEVECLELQPVPTWAAGGVGSGLILCTVNTGSAVIYTIVTLLHVCKL